VRLKELGVPVEREWWIDGEDTTYIDDFDLTHYAIHAIIAPIVTE